LELEGSFGGEQGPMRFQLREIVDSREGAWEQQRPEKQNNFEILRLENVVGQKR
jgi:hypothetical protein